MTRLGWLDCSTGVSGDMLAGALDQLGALGQLPEVIASLAIPGLEVATCGVVSQGVAARRFTVTAPPGQPPRGLDDVVAIVASAAAPSAVRDRAAAVFSRLAAAEATVHGVTPAEVHFHEVGAVDAIVDVLAGCLGLHALGLDELVVSPLALGGGSVATAHGRLPIPGPAVLQLLAGTGISAYGGPVDVELATPTGVALLAEWVTACATLPPLQVEQVGVGVGSRELPDRPNIVRLVVGTRDDTEPTVGGGGSGWRTVSANVDDLDPRLWPGVLDRLLGAGAADAWLTPILMKKGRPAHTVTALVQETVAAEVREVLVTETSTIGVRESPVVKHALQRSWVTVDVSGQPVRVKLAGNGGRTLNLSPEFDDVVAAANALGVPVKDVLARASAAAHRLAAG